jgi:hypothetical protein
MHRHTYRMRSRAWASPDSSPSRVHRGHVMALRPCQEAPTRPSGHPVAVGSLHGELPPSSVCASLGCMFPSFEVLGLLISPYCPCTPFLAGTSQPISDGSLIPAFGHPIHIERDAQESIGKSIFKHILTPVRRRPTCVGDNP